MSDHGFDYGPPLGQGPPQLPGSPPTRPPGRLLLRSGIILVVLGLVGGGALTVAAFRPLVGADLPQPVSGRTMVQAEAGERFALYRLPGIGTAVECSVEGPDGVGLPLTPVLGETVTLGDSEFRTAFTFTATTTGPQAVTCAGDGAQVAVGARIEIIRTVVLALIGIMGGIACVIGGVVCIIVGLVRRSRARSVVAPPPSTWGQTGWG
ncbi:hypothetical protein BH23ACT9_BH23ACT9_03230 [soil metagenome]